MIWLWRFFTSHVTDALDKWIIGIYFNHWQPLCRFNPAEIKLPFNLTLLAISSWINSSSSLFFFQFKNFFYHCCVFIGLLLVFIPSIFPSFCNLCFLIFFFFFLLLLLFIYLFIYSFFFSFTFSFSLLPCCCSYFYCYSYLFTPFFSSPSHSTSCFSSYPLFSHFFSSPSPCYCCYSSYYHYDYFHFNSFPFFFFIFSFFFSFSTSSLSSLLYETLLSDQSIYSLSLIKTIHLITPHNQQCIQTCQMFQNENR